MPWSKFKMVLGDRNINVIKYLISFYPESIRRLDSHSATRINVIYKNVIAFNVFVKTYDREIFTLKHLITF